MEEHSAAKKTGVPSRSGQSENLVNDGWRLWKLSCGQLFFHLLISPFAGWKFLVVQLYRKSWSYFWESDYIWPSSAPIGYLRKFELCPDPVWFMLPWSVLHVRNRETAPEFSLVFHKGLQTHSFVATLQITFKGSPKGVRGPQFIIHGMKWICKNLKSFKVVWSPVPTSVWVHRSFNAVFH